jgi:hypothetical protein
MKRLFTAVALLLAATLSAFSQTVALGPRLVLPYQTVVDSNGVPVPGALLNFYASGTNTRLTTYSDPLLTVPNSNPVVANAAGVFPNIFLNGNYKVVLTDSLLNQIWTADPVDGTTFVPGPATFAATAPVAVAFPSGIVTYSCPTCATITANIGAGQILGNYTASPAEATGVNWMASGASCPAWLSPYQLFTNSNAAPTGTLLTIWDGSQCVTTGTLNQTSHTFSSSLGVGASAINGGISNGLFYDNGAVLGNLATANNGVLVTSSGGVPSISSTLPSGLAIPSPALSGTVTGTPSYSGLQTFSGGATVLSSFTATGLVTNADLVNNYVVINGVTCPLSPTNCPVTATASSITLGSGGTGVIGGANSGMIYQNGTVLYSTSPALNFNVGGVGTVPTFGANGTQGYFIMNNGANQFVILTADASNPGILDVGQFITPGDKTGRINLATLDATAAIDMPDIGTLKPTLNTFQAPILFGGAVATPIAALSGSLANAFLLGYDATFQTYYLQGQSQFNIALPWSGNPSLALVGQAGDIAAQIQGGFSEAAITLGNARFWIPCTTGVCGAGNIAHTSQLYPSDGAYNGVIEALSGVTSAGSSCPNGNYTNVILTGGNGQFATASVTISGGGATAIARSPWSKNYNIGMGADYSTGDVLTVAASGAVPGGTYINCSGAQPTTTVSAVYAPPTAIPVYLGSGPNINTLWGIGAASGYPADQTLRIGDVATGNSNEPWEYSTNNGVWNWQLSGQLQFATNNGTMALCEVQESDGSGTLTITQCGVVATFTIVNGGTGGTPNPYSNVALTDCATISNGCGNSGTGQTFGNGSLTANITINGSGAVSATPTVGNNSGKGYVIGQLLTASPGSISGLVLKVASLATVPAPISVAGITATGAVTLTGITSGTLVSCLGLTSGNAVATALCGGSTITAGTTATSGITSGDLIGSASNLVTDSGIAYANVATLSGTNTFTAANTFALGSITTNIKAINITATFNASGTTFDAPLLENITTTAQANGSLLADIQRGGVSQLALAVSPTTTAPFLLLNSSNAAPSTLNYATSDIVDIQHSGNLSFNITTFGASATGAINLNRVKGTAASPTVVTSGTNLGGFEWGGYNGSAIAPGPALFGFASQTWSTSAEGSYFSFYTVANNSITELENMRLQASGGLTIGSGIVATDPGAGALLTASTINAGSHILATSAAPTISACGTGTPTVGGSDSFGTVTAGTVATSCVVNFGTTWGSAPSCSVSSGTAISSLTVSTSTTQLTITGTALGGDTIAWVCGSTASLEPRDLSPANDDWPPWLDEAA